MPYSFYNGVACHVGLRGDLGKLSLSKQEEQYWEKLDRDGAVKNPLQFMDLIDLFITPGALIIILGSSPFWLRGLYRLGRWTLDRLGRTLRKSKSIPLMVIGVGLFFNFLITNQSGARPALPTRTIIGSQSLNVMTEPSRLWNEIDPARIFVNQRATALTAQLKFWEKKKQGDQIWVPLSMDLLFLKSYDDRRRRSAA